MISKLVAKLDGLIIDEQLSKGIKIHNNYRVTNSFEVFEKQIADLTMKSSMGSLEYNSYESSCFVYAIEHDEYDINDHRQRIKQIDKLLLVSRSISVAAWLIKDNSINIETGYLYTPINGGLSSNRIDPFFYNHEGKTEDIILSREEIHNCINLLTRIFSLEKISNTNFETKDYMAFNNRSKLSRIIAFISLARSQYLVPMKIAFYMTALESILSNSNTEITNQISQNVAHILGNSKEEKKCIYKLIKKGYDVRSSCIHGNNLNNKYKDPDSLFELSKHIDDTVRKVILHIITNDDVYSIFYNEDPTQINDWIENLYF